MKKKLGYLLTMAMLAGMITPVTSASAEAQISIYDNFANYDASGELPDDNWVDPNGYRHSKISPYEDDAINSVTMKLGSKRTDLSWAAKMYGTRKFNQNFDSGVMHISYDAKLLGGSAGTNAKQLLVSMYGACNIADGGHEGDLSTTDQYDYSVIENAGFAYNYAFRINNAGKSVDTFKDSWAYKGANEENETEVGVDSWHKVDMIINQDTKKYSVYVDGVKVSTDDTAFSPINHTKNFKGITFACETDETDDGGYLLDNLYIKSFDKEAAITGPEIKFNDSKNTVSTDKTLELVFTEALASKPTAADIVIKDAKGSAVTNFVVTSADNTRCVVTFNTLPAGGKYTIDTAIVGSVTGKDTAPEEFYIMGTESVASTPFYFMEEDFNDYTGYTTGTYESNGGNYTYPNMYGDIPVGWYDADIAKDESVANIQSKYGKYWQKQGFMLNATEEGFVVPEKRADGDYAVKLQPWSSDWREGITHIFPVGVAGGDFVLEFDVKHVNGGWNISGINYENYDSTFAKQGGHTVGNENLSYALASVAARAGAKLLGMQSDSTDLMLTNKLGTNDNMLTAEQGAVSAGSISANVWTNVKVAFNTNTGIYDVTVTPEGGAASTYKWTDASRGRFEKGLKGIVLTRLKGATVSFDNIKVYKTDSYILNDDFDDYTVTEDAIYAPGGWVRINNQLGAYYDLSTFEANGLKAKGINVAAGSSGTDKSMELTVSNLDSYVFLRAFSRPISKGAAFTVSFDVKTTGSSGWKLLLPNQSHLNYLDGFNWAPSSEKLADNSTTLYKKRASWANVQQKCAVLHLWSGNTYPSGGLRGLILDTATKEDNLTNITVADDTWFNYKLRVTPSADGKATVEVEVKNLTTDKEMKDSFTMEPYQDNTNWYMWPAAGIGFAKFGGTGTVCFDNVKVYEENVTTWMDEFEDTYTIAEEVTAVQKQSVVSVRAEAVDGSSVELTNRSVITPATKRIAIEFTAPVNNVLAEDVVQPLNIIKTSRAILDVYPELSGSLNTVLNNGSTTNIDPFASSLSDEDRVKYGPYVNRYKVYDTLDDVISIKRLGLTSEVLNDVALTKYLSSDKKTCYIELNNDMFTNNADYVLTIAKNISFADSIYSTLEDGVTIKFAAVSENPGVNIINIELLRQAGNVWVKVKDAAEMKALAEAEKTVKLKINGYNDDAENSVDVFAAFAQYNEDDNSAGIMTNAVKEMATFEPGEADGVEVTVTPDSSSNIFKSFVWDWSEMIPLADNIELR